MKKNTAYDCSVIELPKLMWRQVENFSTNSLALILASGPYDANDYIRDYEQFKTMVK